MPMLPGKFNAFLFQLFFAEQAHEITLGTHATPRSSLHRGDR
jgi:hypothetical protein